MTATVVMTSAASSKKKPTHLSTPPTECHAPGGPFRAVWSVHLLPNASPFNYPSNTSTARGAHLFPRTPHTFLTTKLLLWAVHLGPSEVAQPSTPCFPVLVPRTFTTLRCKLVRPRATPAPHSTFPSPPPALPSKHLSPGSPRSREEKKKRKKTVLEANANGIPFCMTAG